MNKNERDLLILAALLHDIGKFCQRAGRPKSSDDVGYCPIDKSSGKPGYLHVLYSDYFIENDLPLPPELEGQRSALARLAASHHKPAQDSLPEQALCQADRLSAGGDRKGEEEARGDYKSARLLSIFEQVQLEQERPFSELAAGRYHALEPLAVAGAPQDLEQARGGNYAQLFTKFTAALADLPLNLGVNSYIGALNSLLEEYTWCIPSSTYKSLPDISLYDHATTTAALAQVLARYAAATGVQPGQNVEIDKKFMLLGGDLSGIQSYIFNLDRSHGSGVAKLFRARSFYLQALTHAVILEICRRLEISPLARVMDAGGRFLLLLPALKEVREQLADFELELQRQMFNRFQGRLSLNLDWSVSLTEHDFNIKRLRGFIDAANDALEQRKLSKFQRLFATGINPVIDLDYSAYAAGDCSICHSHPVDEESSRRVAAGGGNEVQLCRECATQITVIGTRLPRCRYLLYSSAPGSAAVELLFGYHLSLEEHCPEKAAATMVDLVAIRQRGRCAYQPIAAHLPKISDKDMELWKFCDEIKQVDDKWYSGDDAIKAGDPKTFEMLARSARRLDKDGNPVGRSFLGAFKADVDNLGLIFSTGMHNRLSLSRFASLSRMLNHFFSEELVRWIETDWPNLYVIFAGGDDLFLLGPWSDLVTFAAEFNQRFRAWVAERPDITISAGISVHHPGVPVHAIAAAAEDALEKSKGHSADKGEKSSGQSKNAVTMFGVTCSWSEFSTLKEQGDKILGWLDEQIIPRALASRLLNYSAMLREFEAGKIEKGICLSHMRYDFARNVNEKKLPDDTVRAEVLGLQLNRPLLRNIRLPVSYALYRTRYDH